MSMDYEKKYKDALERAKAIYYQGSYKPDTAATISETLQNVFPELKEREDEKMIQYFKDLAPFDKAEELYDKYGFSHKDAIAWLEKQGEKKPILDVEIPFGAKDSELEEVSYNIPNGYHAEIEDKKVVIKKGEKKSIKVPKFKVGDFIQFNGMGHTRYTVKEVCGLSHYINTCNKRMDMSYTDANFELVEQKPAEWSEDDERIKNNLLSELTNLSVRKLIEKETEKKYANWLKSLRHQSQWKPSDEQIGLLQAIVNAPNNASSESCQIVLKEVIRQLKKLK